MKDKIVSWLMTNRAPIGYSIGAANIISGLLNITIGNVVSGLFWVAIGSVIIFDVKMYK
jgi:hypothetical protein